MKIFNWVHRKFNSKDGPNIGEVIKKKGEQHETQALLEQAALADAIDTWKQGILSIGTFGFDHPLKDFTDQQKEIELIIANQEEEEDEEDPLVLNAFKHGFNNDGDDICSDHIPHAQSEITILASDHHHDHEYKKKERITLADLFSADSDHHDHEHHHKLLLQPELGVAMIKIKMKPEEEEPKPKLPLPRSSFHLYSKIMIPIRVQ